MYTVAIIKMTTTTSTTSSSETSTPANTAPSSSSSSPLLCPPGLLAAAAYVCQIYTTLHPYRSWFVHMSVTNYASITFVGT